MNQNQNQNPQQKSISEACRPSPIFNFNHNNNPYNYHQFFQQFQNLPTTHEFFNYQPHLIQPCTTTFEQQQYQEQQQIRRFRTISIATGSGAGVQLDFKSPPPPDLNENSRFKNGGGGGRNQEDGGGNLVGGEQQQYVPEVETRLEPSRCWENREDSAVRQPFWKQFCPDISEAKNIERGIIEAKDKDQEEQPEMNQNQNHHEDYNHDFDEETVQNSCLEAGKSRLFGELEAICGHASSSSSIGKSNHHHKSAAGSLIINGGETLAEGTCLAPPALDQSNHLNNASSDQTLDEVEEDEPFSRMVKKKRKKREKMKDDEISSMAQLFERLVKQLMDHQEILYKKFVDMIERIDKERKDREEAWRKQESEVASKAHERTLLASSSTKESSSNVFEYLERITGKSMNLISPPIRDHEPPLELSNNRSRNNVDQNVMSKRWPKAEVEALIQIRSRFETNFQEPGLKGLLWEEISNEMAKMGFQRSAKRCKEKWENINKYFKKSKENPIKERRQKLKTCEYFDQLDQLYSKAQEKGYYNIKEVDFEGSSNYGKFQVKKNHDDNNHEEADHEDLVGQTEEGEEEDNKGESGHEE